MFVSNFSVVGFIDSHSIIKVQLHVFTIKTWMGDRIRKNLSLYYPHMFVDFRIHFNLYLAIIV